MAQDANHIIADINNVRISDVLGIWEGVDIFGEDSNRTAVYRYYLMTDHIFVYKSGHKMQKGHWSLMNRSGYSDNLFCLEINKRRYHIIQIAPNRMVLSYRSREYELTRSF